MKSIFILIALMAFNIQSCDKFLEEDLVSDVSGSSYYTTPAGLEDAVDATYSSLKYIHSNERAHSLTIFGTDTYTNGADGGHKSFNYYDNGLNSASSQIREMWDELYRGINQANAVINRSQAIEGLDPDILSQRLAEVRFLRAYYYFVLVRQFGDVHLTLEETVGAEVEANKTPQETIYETAIVPDLEFAIATLPDSQSDYGRATKPAAENLLGLVKLTRGYQTFAKADDFSEAERLFGNVIDDYSFALEPDMGKLWDQDNDKNKEIIFSVQYGTDEILNGTEGNRSHLYFLMEYDKEKGMIRDIANGRPFKRFRPTQYLLDVWGANRDNDNRYDLTYKHVWISNNPKSIPVWEQANVDAGAKNADGSPAVVGQPRWAVGDTAIFMPGPGREAKWTPTKRLQTRYVVYLPSEYTERIFGHIGKFIDPRRPAIQWERGSRDWFIMRLGDTYLLRAEARIKQGNTTDAADDINMVRVRAAWPGKEAVMMITPGDVTMDFLLEERARELDAEQERWYTLARTGTLVDRVKLYNPLGAPNIDAHHIHRPIPQNQIDRTSGGYEQNCGYPGGPSCN
ncbi:MAG: RagB/SusD family nutrient uptake outer membrane protein [Cyclobacteriaceae bacterium]|nr:RagB/SusD family nutrient uptake outer membrane protein [Cyclobacteriaceae bacterium]MDH4296695.1 RagB/SusD family nutrient uptake outer membrane protein [Cyclobacteriaceae bacterium]MDH5250601.1 RagB/SusD family nutrient uptake outer membrane protein [Cyclobacteriaceae bacterium]